MQNLDLVFIKMLELISLSKRILSKCLVSQAFYCKIMDCELLKQIVWSFQWHLLIAVRHLEFNESATGADFMVSRIQIRFKKIWPK